MTHSDTLIGVAALALAALWTITPAHAQFQSDKGEGKLADDLKKWNGGKGPTPPAPSVQPKPRPATPNTVAPPSAGGLAAFVGLFDLSGKILGVFPMDTYQDVAGCQKDVETRSLIPARRAFQGRDKVWAVNDNTFLEWTTDKYGRSYWQFTVFACALGQVTPEQQLQAMGVDVIETVQTGIKQIKARGLRTD